PSLSSDKIRSAALTRPSCRSKLKLQSETAKALGLHRAAIKGSPAPTKVISSRLSDPRPTIGLFVGPCPIAVICPTSSEYAARPLLMRAVAIGDCHGQGLNRRNLHDPALSLAQVEPRSRGVAVARR